MKSYYLKCRKDTENINPKFQEKVTIEQWYYHIVKYLEVKKSRFIKSQEAKGLLSNWGIKTPLSKAPIYDDILIYMIFCLKLYI